MTIYKNLLALVFLFFGVATFAQTTKGTITGEVLDSGGESMPFVHVYVEKGEGEIGTATDFYGRFKLDIEPGIHDLTLLFVEKAGVLVKSVQVSTGETSDIGTIKMVSKKEKEYEIIDWKPKVKDSIR